MSFLYTALEIVQDCRVNVSTHTIKSFSSGTAFIDKQFGKYIFCLFILHRFVGKFKNYKR